VKIQAACPPDKEFVMLAMPRGADGQRIIEDGRAKYLEAKRLAARKDKKSRQWLALMITSFIAASRGNLPRARELAADAGESGAGVESLLARLVPEKPKVVSLVDNLYRPTH
jgi:hypothetical protein